jgi:solute carrier family 25 protein 34/35
MYNQPTVLGPNGKMVGTLYKNPIDCLWKTAKTEGVRGWYKGTFAYVFLWLQINREMQDRRHTFCELHHIRSLTPSFPFPLLTGPYRIITLTANDLIINLYKRIRDNDA